jgi:hypothetical protein
VEEHGYQLFVLDSTGQTQQLTQDGYFNYGAHWLDDARLLFMHGEGSRVETHILNTQTGLRSGVYGPRYVGLDPQRVSPDAFVFLEAGHFRWDVARAPLWAEYPVSEGTVPALPPADSNVASTTAPGAAQEPSQGILQPAEPYILRDSPYRSFDHIWAPTLRGPYLAIMDVDDFDFRAGFGLQGQDRLAFHNYAMVLSYDSKRRLPNVDATYLNMMYAPWSMLGEFKFHTGRRSDFWGAQIQAARPLYSNVFFLGVRGLDYTQESLYAALEPLHARVLGLGGGFIYQGSENTPYAGVRRALSLRVQVYDYIPLVTQVQDFTDLSVTLGWVLPLPFLGPRHTMEWVLRGRTLMGAGPEALSVGGVVGQGDFAFLWSHNLRNRQKYGVGTDDSEALLRDELSLQEWVLGYEDTMWLANTVLTQQWFYQWPLIIDQGCLSLGYVLPSAFVQQIYFYAFAANTLSYNDNLHLMDVAPSVGFGLAINTMLGRLASPSMAYSFAFRFNQDKKRFSHLIILGL